MDFYLFNVELYITYYIFLIVTKHFLVMRTFKIYSPSNFQIYNIILLTVVTILYVTTWWLYFIAGGLYLLTHFTHFIHSCLWQQPICSLYPWAWFLLLLYKYCTMPHISGIVQYLSFFIWFISLSIMPSRSTHVVINGMISFFLRPTSILLWCVCV